MPCGCCQVMEQLNSAVEKLYECERLPEDPMAFIAAQIGPQQQQQQQVPKVPTAAAGRPRP